MSTPLIPQGRKDMILSWTDAQAAKEVRNAVTALRVQWPHRHDSALSVMRVRANVAFLRDVAALRV
jgi:hypothetical protein